jgi:glycosyltransferase involved in cell wall biosynthesis
MNLEGSEMLRDKKGRQYSATIGQDSLGASDESDSPLGEATPSSIKPVASQPLRSSYGRFQPTCTVVICTRNRPAELDRCLAGVARLDYSLFDVLVVDNAPSDDAARQVAMRWGARYLVEPAVGLSRARNRGARACDTEILAFLDDDSVPEPGWLLGLANEFQDPLVMAASGPTEALAVETEAERFCALAAASHPNGHGPRVIDRLSPHWLEMANFGGVGDGGNMAVRRQSFEIWPGFDERLGRGALIDGGEEHHAFFSLLELGYRVAYTPLAVVLHPFPPDMQELRRRNSQDLASTAAYITLLLVEQPRHRRALVKYVFEGLRGRPRTWRNSAGQSRPIIVSRSRKLLAWLSGPLLYARSWAKSCTNVLPHPVSPVAQLVAGKPKVE